MDDLTHPEMVLSRHPAGNGLPVTVAVSGAWLRASDHKPLGDGLYHTCAVDLRMVYFGLAKTMANIKMNSMFSMSVFADFRGFLSRCRCRTVRCEEFHTRLGVASTYGACCQLQ